MALTKSDQAKYPFILGAAEEVRSLDIKIENLESDDYKPIVERAEQRIREALNSDGSEVEFRQREDPIETPSFPVAIILAAASASDYIKRRYALAEAKRVYNLLLQEKPEKVLEIARVFNWRIKTPKKAVGNRRFDFALHFTDFLKNTRPFHEKEWKLVNKTLLNGEIYLTKHEVARLLQEEVRRRIEERLSTDVRPVLPGSVLDRVDRLKQEYAGHMEKAQFPELPQTVANEAFPPCIKQLYGAAKSGSHLSHVGRFTLTSFLVNIGTKPEEVIGLFRSSADFNERMTRYQVEHISGDRGSRTKYIPPTCETLRTHGLCPGEDDLCKRVRHPLAYYRKKAGTLKKEVPVT